METGGTRVADPGIPVVKSQPSRCVGILESFTKFSKKLLEVKKLLVRWYGRAEETPKFYQWKPRKIKEFENKGTMSVSRPPL